jgi:hypothetical protein
MSPTDREMDIVVQMLRDVQENIASSRNEISGLRGELGKLRESIAVAEAKAETWGLMGKWVLTGGAAGFISGLVHIWQFLVKATP